MIDVEKAFDVVVRRLGGARVTDLVPDTGNLPRNADYVLKPWNVIAELKQLDDNLLSTLGIKQRIGKEIASWERQGLVKPLQGRPVNLVDLPQECAWKLTGIAKRNIETNIAKSASDQIKSTRRMLDMPDASGLLIIAHEGNSDMTPETFMHLIGRSLGGSKHPGVDDIIYMSANVPVTIPGGGSAFPWAHFHRSNRPGVPDALLQVFRAEWIKLHQELTGLAGVTINGDDEVFRAMSRPK